jgi:hypothetical protein
MKHPLRKINYSADFLKVDFFRSLGREHENALMKDWYTNKAGDISICAEHLTSGTDQWRKMYWDNSLSAATNKLPDWKHEEEYRLVHNSPLGDISDGRQRTFCYDFSDLVGVIFGISFRFEDKARIIDIIHEKCAQSKRTDFEFHQAYLSPKSGGIEIHHMGLLKFTFQ